MRRLAAGLLVALATAACGADSPSGAGSSTAPNRHAVKRPLGQWRGAESQTIGFTSESGRLRIAWTARTLASDTGTFRASLHSAVSGRPLAVLTEQVGNGHSDLSEDPRPYNILIDASGVVWTIAVEELVAAAPPP